MQLLVGRIDRIYFLSDQKIVFNVQKRMSVTTYCFSVTL